MDHSKRSRPNPAPCARTRLAESEVAAVDLCDCGMMQLHLGPFSLRLTPDALSKRVCWTPRLTRSQPGSGGRTGLRGPGRLAERAARRGLKAHEQVDSANIRMFAACAAERWPWF